MTRDENNMSNDGPPATKEMEMKISHVEVGGQRLRLAATEPRGASSTPLLLLNGLGASLELLEPFTAALRGTRTIAFDLPGVGGSSRPRMLRRLGGLARLVHDLLDLLGEEQVDVLGVSWGGALAQQFALQHPERCRRLVLAATSTGQLMVPALPHVLLRMMTPMRYASSGYFRRIAGSIYGGDFRHDRELVRRHAKLMAPPSMRGYLSQLYALSGWTSLFRLHRIRQPTLVMAGADDPLIPKVNAEILAAGIPNARLATFDCGHLFLLTRTEQVVEVLDDFLGPGTLNRM